MTFLTPSERSVRAHSETTDQRAKVGSGPFFVRSTRFRRTRHVRFASIASEPSHRSDSTRCALDMDCLTAYNLLCDQRNELLFC